MNYNIESTYSTPTQIEYSVDENRQYGQLPFGQLKTKFEETDMGDEENLFDEYARGVLTNYGPDNNFFAYEEPRSSQAIARGGHLNSLLYMDRSGSDPAAHPEMFLGFQGSEDWDPRGTAVDPDFKKFAAQNNERMRFIRWAPDACDQVTGLGRSESKAIADNQSVFKWVRDTMKWFTTSKDGRREGLRRTYQYRPEVEKQVVVRGYGDAITDFALNPQRRSVLISDRIIRDSKWYRDDCNEADWCTHVYGQADRRRLYKTTVITGSDSDHDAKFSQSEVNKCYKAVGMLLAELVRDAKTRRDVMKGTDVEFAEDTIMMARKHEMIVRDLSLIMRSITADNSWGNSEVTKMMKTKTPDEVQHMARLIVHNHLLPANHYLNATLMYKSVKPGADTISLKKEMITDSRAPDIRDANTIFGKMSHLMPKREKLNDSRVELETESNNTHNYKSAKAIRDKSRQLNLAPIGFAESDNTPIKKLLMKITK